MAIQGAGFKWYDGFFLSMLAFSIIMVVISWDRYHLCTLPLHLWIAVDYATVFVFRLLMFVDNVISAAVGVEYGRQLRGTRFFARVVVLSILYGVLYPFLWAWTVIGVIWFASAQDCLPEKNQKWGYIVWLLFSFCGLVCLAGNFGKKWFRRRRAHQRRAPRGSRVSEFRVVIEHVYSRRPYMTWKCYLDTDHLYKDDLVFLSMIRQPDVAYETAIREMRLFDQDTGPTNQGMTMSEIQRAALDTAIQRIPIFILKAVPTDCSDCPICLEEFIVGQAVRGLPCAHTFHLACIDKWIRVNIKCPRCRCCVFPFLNPNNATTVTIDPDRSSISTTQPSSSSYLVRMQSFFLPINEENASPSDSSPTSTSTTTITTSSSPGTDTLAVEKEGETSESSGESV